MERDAAWVFRAFFDQSRDASLICAPDGICQMANAAAVALFGVEPDALYGQPFADLVTGEAAETLSRLLEGACGDTGRRVTLRRMDGTTFSADVQSRWLNTPEDGLLHVQITPRAAAPDETANLGERAFLLQSLIDSLPDYVYVKDRDSRFIINNLSNARAINVPLEDTIGKRDFDFHPPEMAAQYYQDEQTIFRTGEPLINHEELVAGPNGPVWASTTKVPLHDAAGSIIAVLGVTRDISDQRAREKQMVERERFVEKITQAIPDILYIYDRVEDTYLFINWETVAKGLGYHPEEQETWRLNLEHLMHPDDGDAITRWSALIDAASDGDVIEMEFRLRRKDGGWRWYMTRDQVFNRDQDGWPCQTLGIAQDITERKQAEQKLRQRNDYLKALSEILPGLVNHLDPMDLLRTLLDRACALVGTKHGFVDLLEPAKDAGVKLLSTGEFDKHTYIPVPGEGLGGLVWASGQTIVVEDYATWPHRLPGENHDTVHASIGVPLKSGHQVVGILGLSYWDETRRFSDDEIEMLNRLGEIASIALDNARLYSAAQHEIAERKQAEEALQKERDFVSAILSTTFALVHVLDPEGRFVTFNRHCEEVSGYTFEEVKGRFLWDLFIVPEEVERVKQVFRRLSAGDYPNINVNYWKLRDGSLRLIEFSNTALTDEHGHVTHIVSAGLDITARKQLEESNLELAVEREKVKILANFVRDASHDFRTPLSILNTNLYMLRKINDKDQQLTRIEEMERQVMQVNDMLDQLLTMTRLDTGVETTSSRVSVNDLVRDIRTRLHTAALQKGIDLRLELDERLPYVKVDGSQLSQALTNLVTNAIQYSSAGDEVSVRTFEEVNCLGIEVRDTGVGIDAKDLPYVFERFYRTDPARSRNGTGAGLGLPIAKKIIEMHGGKILMDSIPGEGSTFTVLLPAEAFSYS